MFKNFRQSSKGAIDLASIMVGIVVIGLIGGVIAATIFAVIPWAQDNAAKNQLDAIATAQSAYAGLAASEASGLGSLTSFNFQPTSTTNEPRTFASLEQLNAKGLFKVDVKTDKPTVSADGKLCASFDAVGKKFDAAVVSGSGNVFSISSTDMTPSKVLNGETCIGTVTDGKIKLDLPEMVSIWDTSITTFIPEVENPTSLMAATAYTKTCDTIHLPISEKGADFSVDWGDGTVNDKTTHTYSGVKGQKTVTTSGSFGSWGKAGSTGPSIECLTQVTSWGETGTTDLERAFSGYINLTDVKEIPSGVTTMWGMFDGATNFAGTGKNWDTSKVTHMTMMFGNTDKFNGDISGWDTSNVIDMYAMFYNTLAFNADISGWDVSSVVNTQEMFRNAYAFNADISGWNTSNVKFAGTMFADTRVFNQDLSGWDTSNIVDMSHMFAGAEAFNQNISGWNVDQVDWFNNFNLNSSLAVGNIPAKFRV